MDLKAFQEIFAKHLSNGPLSVQTHSKVWASDHYYFATLSLCFFWLQATGDKRFLAESLDYLPVKDVHFDDAVLSEVLVAVDRLHYDLFTVYQFHLVLEQIVLRAFHGADQRQGQQGHQRAKHVCEKI